MGRPKTSRGPRFRLKESVSIMEGSSAGLIMPVGSIVEVLPQDHSGERIALRWGTRTVTMLKADFDAHLAEIRD